MHGRSSTRTAVAALVLACCLALSLGLAGTPASAGDGVTLIYFDSDRIDSSGNDITIDAHAGETITLELVVSDDGDYSSNGIDELSATVAYSPDVFEVTTVEHGPMLAAGDADAEVEGSIDVDDENGTIAIDQERTPSGDGAIATDAVATITIDVAEDAEPTTETLEVTDASATLVTDYPRNFVDRTATIYVEGGAPDDADDESDGDGDDADTEHDGVTLADDETEDEDSSEDDTATDEGATDESDGETEAESASDDNSIPGFGVPAALVAIAAWLGLRIRQ